MNANAFRAALEKLDLTQGEAADLLFKSIRSINGYAAGTEIPKDVEVLLAYYLKYGTKLAQGMLK